MTAPVETIRQLVDVLRRADPAYCKAHGVEQITDAEWDAALEAGEDAIEQQQEQPA